MKITQTLVTITAIVAMCVPIALAQGRGGHGGGRGGGGHGGGACCAEQDGKSPDCCGSPTTESKACCDGDAQKTAGENKKSHRELMRDAHTLVFNNEAIVRTIEEIPGGVRTVTTTSDPELLKVLQRHPKEMGAYYHDGGMVRGWDPVFRALAQHGDKVNMDVKEIENGVEVTATSEDKEVAKLIRAHAYKVSEFVNRGREAMHEPTPLPEDYEGTQ